MKKQFWTSILGLALATLSLSSNAVSQEVPELTLQQAEQLREQALESTLALDITASLTTEVGARLPGTDADKKAVEWGMAKLQSLGFDKVWKEPVSIPVWLRLHESAEVIAPFPQNLIISALGGSVSTPKNGLEAEIIHFDSIEALESSADGSANNKIVYISKRMEKHSSGRGYGDAGPARFRGAASAAKKGAIGLVIRSIGTDSQRSPHTGVTSYEDGVTKIPAAALSNPDADQLDRILAHNKTTTMRLNIQTEVLPDATTYNVIGEITGSERPDEIVAIGGHLDSWDQGTGAVDDASGIGITVAAAKLIAQQQRPKRTIRVVMFGAEEIGVFGGKQYALDHADELAKHIIGAESDGGAGKVLALSSSVSHESLHVVDEMLKLMAPLGVVRSSAKATGSADFGPMVRAGMPAVGLVQDFTPYFDIHHTPDDTFDKIVPEELAQNVAAWVIFVKLAADWPGRFN
ncbi:M20/M25/M40 family metallo-hydrolase [Aliiglaciecola sp. LCG003]|uniref:M20/M25/M40 family metallo-hydrolase n=1 Tax=Aliiglaciecola sp. LCG003 TaxID=3053655 RepID=UPI002573DC64|nr:M20/M25/M40 family metallo-hydrolase [Aliiglaciecola sp. LCG003]WJG10122.1 M20/M25/M40 family metallo-hydrolase [Aliiglaciecola sp. LCG003]